MLLKLSGEREAWSPGKETETINAAVGKSHSERD